MAYTSLFRELLTYMMEDARAITPCTHLLFIAKNLERVGDHVTNIAENIWFQVHADAPLPPRRSEEHTSELQSLMRTSYAVFCLKKKKSYYYFYTNQTHTPRLTIELFDSINSA